MQNLTLEQLLTQTTKALEPRFGKEHSFFVAGWIINKLTDNIFSKSETQNLSLEVVSPEVCQKLQTWVDLLITKNYPLQYLLEEAPFGNIEIFIQAPILIPRPETEEWVMQMIANLQLFKKYPLKILDLCSGSGCIGLSFAHAFPGFTVHAVDKNPQAIALIEKNIQHLQLKNITALESDMFTKLAKQNYDIIICNPPYVTADEYEQLDDCVKLWEDKHALVADNNGLAFYELIAQEAQQYLNPKSLLTSDFCQLFLEIGETQAHPVTQLLQKNKWHVMKDVRDFNGKPRLIAASVKG
ncbi:MAG: peptide chain release factor N(5)-glutamine methyltransferase [Proteobacteria bacterium]|nr:peptide chain release factor N(5)-glutamine methyltransferase [Pseudomonadota bacterium]NBP14727.1 peptide chain release factor N(5)-glutamine methyltransferase [bacterium]